MEVSKKTMAHALRMLAVDAIEQAQSGHPGMPLGMADIATVLWHDFFKHDPKHPNWPNRDRLVISNGHGVMLLYGLLHLSGYPLTLDDLRNFRQWQSRTPGHPEYGLTPGVDASTGPLGQGLANAVGMAIAEQRLHADFGDLVNHFTYCFVGDGCLMEGISHEACSLAGTLGLGKLIVLWDHNGICIDGATDLTWTDDTSQRFESYNWHVLTVDGHNQAEIAAALTEAQTHRHRPTLIACRTTIGYGAGTLAGTARVHGAPLGPKARADLCDTLSWPYEPFVIPEELYRAWSAQDQGQQAYSAWQQLCKDQQQQDPKCYQAYQRQCVLQEIPKTISSAITAVLGSNQPLATRAASQHILAELTASLPELFGGSADLSSSNLTQTSHHQIFNKENRSGNYLYYGVREFAMSAIMNGLALHGGLIPYGGTFLVFSDYARNAIRMAALMKIKVIFVYTHDSIGLGEDGPSHQPIEHLTMLRATPDLNVWRPADLVETAGAWQHALHYQGPSALVLSRQKIDCQASLVPEMTQVHLGGYIRQSVPNPQLILIATGSELALALEVAAVLPHVQVVSMPCVEIFEQQPESYQQHVLPETTPRVILEAGAPDKWYKFKKEKGLIFGIDTFGASAPAKELWQAYGFTVTNVVEQIKKHFA